MEKLVDIALIAIIIICGWTGYKKGLIMGVGGIIAISVSLTLAIIISNAFSYEVIPAIRPFVAGYMEPQYETAIYDELGIEIPEEDEESTGDGDQDGTQTQDASQEVIIDERALISTDDLVNDNPEIERTVYFKSVQAIGIFEKPSGVIADKILDYKEETGTARLDSLSDVLCGELTFVAGFIISFAMILIVLTVVGNVLNLSFKIPGYDLVNDISGTVFGVLTGLFFCSMVAYILNYTGALISEEDIMGTWVTSIFVRLDFIAGIIAG